ncbi:MAG TPA: PAS domain S-box protein [Methanomassiliicoccales archaeon]|jgi:PAS domain S-box-containing protein
MIRTIYIDDEPLLLELAKDFIEDGVEFTMDTTTSVDEAIRKVMEGDYDAVICDYQMPAMNGVEFLKALRSKGDVTPFVLFTGRGREEVVIDALNNGVDFYLKKGGEPSSQFAELKNLLIQMSRRRQAEDAMTHNARRFRAMIENSMDIIGVMDRNSTLRYVSPSISKILGYSVDEVIGTNLQTYSHPDLVENLAKIIQTIKMGRTERYEISLRHKNGTYRLIEASIAVMPTELGPNQIVVNGRDITERRKKEDELRHSEEMVRYIVGHAPNSMAIQDMDLRYLMVSDQYLSDFDLYNREVIGRRPVEVFSRLPDEWKEICDKSLSGKIMKGELDFPLENRMEHIFYDVRPWHDVTGEVGGLVTYIGPKMGSQAIKEEFARSEQRYRLLADNAKDVLWTMDAEGRFTYVSPSVQQLRGYTAEEVMAQGLDQALTPESSRLVKQFLNEGLEALKRTGRFPEGTREVEQPRKDGTTVWTEVRVGGLYDPEGRFVSILGVSRDITDRRNAELGWRESEERFRAMFDNSQLGTFIIDLDGRFQESNQLFSDMLSHEMAELMKLSMADVTQPPMEVKRTASVRRLLEQNLDSTDIETDFRRRDGRVWSATISLSVLKDRNGVKSHLIGMVHNVIPQKESEEGLAESERRFRTLFQNTQLAITIADLNGSIIETNDQFAKMMGYFPEELKGLNVYDLQTPRIRAEESELVSSLLNHQVDKANVDRHWVRKDGSMWWGHVVGSLLYDDQGIPKHILAVIVDITERKNSEMKMAIANRKLTLLGDLTRHDVKNRISAMAGFMQLANLKETDPQIKTYLSKASQLAIDISAQMDFSKEYQGLGAQEATWISLTKECFSARSDMDLGNITLECGLHGVEIFADPMVPKGFRNIIENSCEHGQHVTKITVGYREVEWGLEIIFEDNGVGIADSDKQMIFEWGYKNRMGHGLHFVAELLAITGMSIKETGEFGKGARFEVFVPCGAYRITGDR